MGDDAADQRQLSLIRQPTSSTDLIRTPELSSANNREKNSEFLKIARKCSDFAGNSRFPETYQAITVN
jgi:hypothetical protein